MKILRSFALPLAFCGASLLSASFGSTLSKLQAQIASPGAVSKRIGTIKAIGGNLITLAPASGAEVAVTVQANARILRIAPGEKDFKNATPVQLQELQVGDMIRVRGQASDDAKSITALEVIVITRSTLDAVSEQIRQDWQKRGSGGLVSAVDAGAGTVTLSVGSFGSKKTVAVHTTKQTAIRRYAPDSVKFDDAKPSTLQEIHAGDQLRVRGERSADGAEIAAEEIVSGSFRNVAGTVVVTDAGANTVTVQDLFTKKPVQVKITSDSQLHQLPAEFAQRIAARLKSALPPGTPGAATSGGPAATAPTAGAGPPSGGASGGMGGGPRSGGAPDLQQMLNRMPAVTLNDLHKGDAVMIVSTQGGTAITLLSGVDAILQAAPTASSMTLTPWSLGGPSGDAGNQ